MPRNRGARQRVATGIYRDARGFELQACVGGERKAARLPLNTSRAALQAAMEDLRSGLRTKAKKRLRRRGAKGTLRAVAPQYLAAVKGMASYKSRRRQIELWVDVLGDRKLAMITHLEIAQQLQRWRTEPRDPQHDASPPYSEQYVIHLRNALSHLFETLDPDADNPVDKVQRARTPELVPRTIPLAAFMRILRHFPRGSKMRARLALMAATGLGQSEVMRLRPEDVNLATGVLVARARRKGRGSEARAIPLTRHAVRAARLFVCLDAFGTFATSNLRRDFRLAAAGAGYVLRDDEHPDGLDWRPYDARHLFGSEVGRLARDERAVQQLLGHADIRTTRRYTQASVDPRVAAAVAALNAGGRKMGPQSSAETKRNRPTSSEVDA